MNWRVVLVGIATFFLASIASAEAVVYRNAEYGFSLKPPPFPAETAFGIGATPVTFQGAAKDGVAPNCNVQIQNVNLTPAQYKELSLNQFNVIGLSMRAEEDRKVSGKEAFFWRYGGAGVEAVALVVFATKRVYLVTCLASVSNFAKEEARFMGAINSFALE